MAAEKPSLVTAPTAWQIFKRHSGLVLGFHGCDRKVGTAVLDGKQTLEPSKNNYDWLGSGTYFWEADPWRALDFANEACEKGFITSRPVADPYAIGAIIDLGVCCNLMDINCIAEVKKSHGFLKHAFDAANIAMPTNNGGAGMKHNLDCMVIELMHAIRKGVGATRQMAEYQTVRAAYIEGDPIYDGARFSSKNHIQIAVRDESCIKGYFRLPGL